MTGDELAFLISPEGQAALRQFASEDPSQLALSSHRYPQLPMRAIAEQLHLRRQQRDKLGPWSDHLILTAQAAEQAASYATASWKAKHLYPPAPLSVDSTAGLGVDALALAARGQRVRAIEHDPLLADLLRINALRLSCLALEVVTGDALSAIAEAPPAALIIADPDRRASGRRSLDPATWSPPPAAIAAAAGQRPLILKLSPGTDSSALDQELPSGARRLALSVGGEAKELLWTWRCDLAADQAVGLNREGHQRWSWSRQMAEPPHCPISEQLGEVAVEPDPAIICNQLVADVLTHFRLYRLHPQVAFAHGADPGPQFPGTRLFICDAGPWDQKALRQLLRRRGLERLRVSRRHFPWDPPTILKRLGLREGGQHRLLCYRDQAERLRWILAAPMDESRETQLAPIIPSAFP